MPNPVSHPTPPSDGTPKSTTQGKAPPSLDGSAPNGGNPAIAMWQKFLSVGGHVATPEQAKQFMAQVMKAISSYMQQCSDRLVKATRRLRNDGDDDSD